MNRNRVFISYSHKDNDYLERLKVHLKALERDGLIDVWSDKQIKPGDDWQGAIEIALNSASAAILLISADFLASDFIANNELPKLLKAAEHQGTRIISVILKPCAFSRMPELAKFQAVNDPTKPIISLGHWKREEIWDRVSSLVFETFSRTDTLNTDVSQNDNKPEKQYEVGQHVRHYDLGEGIIVHIGGTSDGEILITVQFDDVKRPFVGFVAGRDHLEIIDD